MNDWLTINYEGTSQTGPASAINALADDLADKGIAFTVDNYNVTPTYKKTTRKTIDAQELEVR